MPHKFFYSWQSERPTSVSRKFIRKALETVSSTLSQSGIDERVEIDSDTQDVPGTPEIFSTILSKIEDAAVFVADLTICAETTTDGNKRLFPNSNVMFEYGYALTRLRFLSNSSRTTPGGRRIFPWKMRKKLDAVRLALRRGEIVEAAKHGRVFELTPISA